MVTPTTPWEQRTTEEKLDLLREAISRLAMDVADLKGQLIRQHPNKKHPYTDSHRL